MSVIVGGSERKAYMAVRKATKESRELSDILFFNSQGHWAVHPLLCTFKSLPVLFITLSPESFRCKREDPDGVGPLFEGFESEVL